MSPQEVGQTVCHEFDCFAEHSPTTAGWNELRERLLIWFRSVDEPLAFDGMMWVFEHSRRYQHQQLAGELLKRRSIPLPISAREFIQRIAPGLDASANEVVRYFVAQIGKETAQQELNAVIRGATDAQMRDGLRHLSYWLGIPQTVEGLGF